MSDLIKIMLVEDDPMVCESYQMTVKHRSNMAIVYETGSEQQALGYVMAHAVDVIILDRELKEGDGVSFLDELAERTLEKPFIVVVTNNNSSIMLRYIREHGADYIYQKNNISYSPSKVFSIIEKICPYRNMMRESEKSGVKASESRECDDDVRRQYVEEELQKMGFRKKQVGFPYIVDAVMIMLDCSGTPPHLTSEVYPLIARQRNVSKESVERSIRHAIEVTFRDIDEAHLHRYYPYKYDTEMGRPSNRDFLIGFAERVRL